MEYQQSSARLVNGNRRRLAKPIWRFPDFEGVEFERGFRVFSMELRR